MPSKKEALFDTKVNSKQLRRSIWSLPCCSMLVLPSKVVSLVGKLRFNKFKIRRQELRIQLLGQINNIHKLPLRNSFGQRKGRKGYGSGRH